MRQRTRISASIQSHSANKRNGYGNDGRHGAVGRRCRVFLHLALSPKRSDRGTIVETWVVRSLSSHQRKEVTEYKDDVVVQNNQERVCWAAWLADSFFL